jgi:hypothetical protein
MTIIPAYRTRISKNWKWWRHRTGSDDRRLPAGNIVQWRAMADENGHYAFAVTL